MANDFRVSITGENVCVWALEFWSQHRTVEALRPVPPTRFSARECEPGVMVGLICLAGLVVFCLVWFGLVGSVGLVWLV